MTDYLSGFFFPKVGSVAAKRTRQVCLVPQGKNASESVCFTAFYQISCFSTVGGSPELFWCLIMVESYFLVILGLSFNMAFPYQKCTGPNHTSFSIWGKIITFIECEVHDIVIVLQISYMNLNETMEWNYTLMTTGRGNE